LGFALPTLSAKLRRLAGPFDNFAVLSCSGQAKIEPAAEILSGVEGTRIRVGQPIEDFTWMERPGQPPPKVTPTAACRSQDYILPVITIIELASCPQLRQFFLRKRFRIKCVHYILGNVLESAGFLSSL
jgi:hypothetical protein